MKKIEEFVSRGFKVEVHEDSVGYWAWIATTNGETRVYTTSNAKDVGTVYMECEWFINSVVENVLANVKLTLQ